MSRAAITIILVQALACFRVAEDAKSPLNPFVQPFNREDPLTKVEEFYSSFGREYLYLNSRYKGSLKDTLVELVTFDWATLKLDHLGDLTPEQIQAQIVTIFNSRERDILSDRFASIEAPMKKLARDLILRCIQLNRVADIESVVIDETKLRAAAVEFKEVNNLVPVKANLMAKTIADQLSGFTTAIVPLYIHFVVFQQQAFNVLNDFLRGVLKGIDSGAVKIGTGNKKTSAETVMALLVATSYLYSNDLKSYEYVAAVAREAIRPGCANRTWFTKDFFTGLYDAVLALFYNTHSTANTNEAKRLFVEFFLPDNYAAPTAEYLKFMMLKYIEEGFKGGPSSDSFVKLQKIYLVDLVYTSLFHRFELINEKQTTEILATFPKVVEAIGPKDMAHFDHFRRLMLHHSDLLNRYENFFSNLYNLGLFFVQYASWNDKRVTTATFPGLFDELIEMAWKRDGGFLNALWNGALPDETKFEMSVVENYVAYKLLNMQLHATELSRSVVKFAPYEDLQDKNIEELLFENEKFQDLVLTLKEVYLNNRALNYGVFAKLTVDQAFWKRLREVSPALFEAKTFVNII